jgi:uncharacterized protein DUF4160
MRSRRRRAERRVRPARDDARRAPDQSVVRDRDLHVLQRPSAAPHFHAQYGGVEAVVAISDGAVIRGSIPDRALRLVREWLELHREEVEPNWRLASRPAPLDAIDPLP